MKCKAIISIFEEQLAPLKYAESWDNVGLLIGDEEKQIHKIMIALDATKDVIIQAIEGKADMLITHHPMVFSPIKKITYDDFTGRRIIDIIRNDISYYAMHTNFDAMVMANVAAKSLNLTDTSVLKPDIKKENQGFGQYGYLKDKMTLEECAAYVKKQFRLNYVNVVGDGKRKVSFVAVSPGSGKSMIESALLAGVDVLITGDIDHHNAIDAYEQGLCIIDGGHFGTEHLMVDYVKQYLMEYLKTYYHGSEDIQILTANEHSPFVIM